MPFFSQKRAGHITTGERGETVAVAYLRRKGFRIHSRNVRIGRDEIDVIAWDPADGLMVFVEVKSRSRFDRDYRPELNMTSAKLHKIRRGAQRWMDQRGYEGSWRVDLICVVAGRVTDHRLIGD